MDLPSEKRGRKGNSASSSSEEFSAGPPGPDFLFQSFREVTGEDQAKRPAEEGQPTKRPKMFDFEMRKQAVSTPSGISASIALALEALRNCDFPALLEALRTLASEITMTNDDLIASLPIETLTEVLVFGLNSDNPEIVLHSMICVSFLVDSHHSAATYFVKAGVVSLLTRKILNIEYIDLAEYAVKSLEKISYEFPAEVLRKAFFAEILPMIDFFDISVQKKMFAIVLNVCRNSLTKTDFYTFLEPCLPVLLGFLDNKVKDLMYKNEKSLEILACIIESLKSVNEDEGTCMKLLDQGVIFIVLEVINEFPNLTAKGFKLLACLCKSSLKLTASFINIGFGVLSKSIEISVFEENSLILTESLQLIRALLPLDGDLARFEFFGLSPNPVLQLALMIFPNISSMYEVLGKKNTKVMLLDLSFTILQMTSAEQLLGIVDFSPFLSGLLVEREGSVVKACLKIIGILYDKIPMQVAERFVRHGVVYRVLALKDPENLKCIVDEKHADPFEFEQFLLSYRRTRAMSDHHELHISRPRLLSETRDNTFDVKKEIIRLSKQLIEKHNACDNQSGFKVSSFLKSLSSSFDLPGSTSSIKSLYQDLISCIKTDNPTAFELSTSNLATSLWDYLTFGGQESGDFSRIQEFLNEFESHSGGLYFDRLLELLLTTFNYLDFNVVTLQTRPSSRSHLNKLRIHLQYVPNDDLPDEFRAQDEFFRRFSKFSITPDPALPVSTLTSMLKKIQNKEDLIYFKESIREECLETEDQVSKTCRVQLMFNGGELPCSGSLNDLQLSSSETPVIKFKFHTTSRQVTFISNPHQIFSTFISNCSKVGLDQDNPAYPYLRFINFLFNSISNSPFPHVDFHKHDLSKFISPKLNSIVSKQFSDQIHLTRKLVPTWMKELPKHSWFLFNYSTRLRILDNFRYHDFTRNQRQKVRVDRNKVLEGARILMNDRSFLLHGVLEVMFDDEIGTGNGPTLEFFSLLAEKILEMNIWRKGNLLFPMPWELVPKNEFFFIGRLVGKAILDKRYIELPLNPVFWKQVQRKTTCFYDLKQVDEDLYKFVLSLKEFHKKYKENSANATYNEVSIEDLHLFFTLPGYESIELVEEGKNIQVTLQNLDKYIDLVVERTIYQENQVNEFREGLCSLIPLDSILGFSADELEELICGSHNEVWDIETLRTCIKPAHGYNESSKNFQNLLKIMTEFDRKLQRKFLQFTTGCPRLPLGGFYGLNPCLTVVKKEDGEDPDKYLPSVMTCQNYLKIPNYSNEEVLRKNLFLALEEGYSMFHLS